MIMSFVSSKLSSSLFVPTSFCFMCQDKNNKRMTMTSFLPPSLLLSSSSSARTVVSSSNTIDGLDDETTTIVEEDDDVDDDGDGVFAKEVSTPSEEEEENENEEKEKDVPSVTTKHGEDVIPSSSSSSSSSSSLLLSNNTNTTMKLRQVSNIASLLCILDCTLLPIITMALPLFGILVESNNNINNNTYDHHQHHQHHHHHHNHPNNSDESQTMEYWCHQMALYFVLPIGLLTGLMNYFLFHKKLYILITAVIGLTLIGLANSSCHIIDHDHDHDHDHHLHALFGRQEVVVVEFLHMIHDHQGPVHRIINILGCILLLGSNSMSSHH